MENTIKEFSQIITDLICFRKIAKRIYFINPSKKLIYLNNQKAACTSLKVSMFNYNNVMDDGTISIILLSRSRYRINKKDYPDYFSYTYVRNPFAKMVSLYKNKIVEEKGRHFKNYLFGVLEKDRGFEDFINKVAAIPDIIADSHFISQHEMIYYKEKCLVDFVGKFESIDESYPEIQEKYQLGKLPHFNKTKKGNWMDYYTIPLAKKVYKRYKKDIELFGYESDYRDLIQYLKSNKN